MATMTEAEARAHLVATALAEVGYDATPRHSRYGDADYWPHDSTWEWQGLWCARGASWAYAKAFGVEAAIAGIGKQPNTPLPAGWAATWLWREHLRSNGLHVGFANARPGDIIFYRFPNPGGGRSKNPTNHVSLVVENRGAYLRCVGFNTPRPGAGGDPDAGGGVWIHNRYLTSVVVAVYQANWPALLTVYNAQQITEGIQDLTQYAEALAALGYPATTAGVRAFQQERTGAPHHLEVDGIFGPLSRAALEADMATLQSIEAKLDALSTVTLTDSQMAALSTGQRDWEVTRLLALYGHRLGWMFQRTANTRDAVNEMRTALPGVVVDAVTGALGDLPGVDPEVIRSKVVEAIESVTVTLDVPEEA